MSPATPSSTGRRCRVEHDGRARAPSPPPLRAASRACSSSSRRSPSAAAALAARRAAAMWALIAAALGLPPSAPSRARPCATIWAASSPGAPAGRLSPAPRSGMSSMPARAGADDGVVRRAEEGSAPPSRSSRSTSLSRISCTPEKRVSMRRSSCNCSARMSDIVDAPRPIVSRGARNASSSSVSSTMVCSSVAALGRIEAIDSSRS